MIEDKTLQDLDMQVAALVEQSQNRLADKGAFRAEVIALRGEEVCMAAERGELPLPSALKFDYELLMAKAFVDSLDKARNFLCAMSESFCETVSFDPVILDIEPTARCNFRCHMCQVKGWPNGKRCDDLDFSWFKDFIASQKNLLEIKLQGIGEPLLHPNFYDMVALCVQQGLWVRTTVNGSLLHLNNGINRMIDVGTNEVQISIDGATKEVFESIRPGSCFKTVVENVKKMNVYAASVGRPVASMWVLLQKDNIHQFFDFVRLAEDLGFKRLSFNLSLSNWGQKKYENMRENSDVSQLVTQDDIAKLIRINEQVDVDISMWNLADKYNVVNKCLWPFSRAYIGADKRIAPCCMIGNPEVLYLGDASDWSEAWNGKQYQWFRKAHLEGDIPSICKNCYV